MPAHVHGSEIVRCVTKDALSVGDPLRIIGTQGTIMIVRRALAREKPDLYSGHAVREGAYDGGRQMPAINGHSWSFVSLSEKEIGDFKDRDLVRWNGTRYVTIDTEAKTAGNQIRAGRIVAPSGLLLGKE